MVTFLGKTILAIMCMACMALMSSPAMAERDYNSDRQEPDRELRDGKLPPSENAALEENSSLAQHQPITPVHKRRS